MNNRLRKALLQLHELSDGHAGAEVAPRVIQTLERYGIKSKVGYVTRDNASENDTLCNLLAEELDNWDPIERRLRCFGHIINLAVQAFLFAKNKKAVDYATQASQAIQQDTDQNNAALSTGDSKAGWIHSEPLQKILQFVAAIHTRDSLYNAFRRLCSDRTIHKPNDTPWNSYYDCFESAYALQLQYNQFLREREDLAHLELTMSDWRVVKETCEFLRPFKDTAKQCEGDQVTLDQLQSSMDYILAQLRKAKNRYSTKHAMNYAVYVAWHAFDKYYSLIDQSAAYAAAILLRPNRRKAYLEAAWLKEWVSNGIERAKVLWSSYNVEAVNTVSNNVQGKKQSDYEQWLAGIQSIQRSKLNDEFERFINGPAKDVGILALDWWLLPAQQRTYPRLSKMAIDVLSAPAMSAEAERVFSHGRSVIPWSRALLSADTINQILCLKHWMSTGLVTELSEVDLGEEMANQGG